LLRLKYSLDLVLAALFSLLLIAVVFTGWVPARVAVGVPFLIFIPGHALLAAFFPDRERLDLSDRLAYGVGLSLALVILDGLLLNYVWKLDVYPLLISLEAITLPLLFIAWRRRVSLPEHMRLSFSLGGINGEGSFWDFLLVTMLSLALVGAGAVAWWVGYSNVQPYSEFYLLGAQGQAADYPQSLQVGQPGQVTLVVANHQRQSFSYEIKAVLPGSVSFDGVAEDQLELTVDDGQKVSYNISFSFDQAGPAQKIEFDLYVNGTSTAYLRTYLKLEVTG
jgi:uncharacterized membrane protein